MSICSLQWEKRKREAIRLRRQEFSVTERQEIETFLQEMGYGFLGTVNAAGEPRVTPLNFVYYKGKVYFHGSKIGEKMASMAANDRVSFSVAREFSQIPSYWLDPELACPATVFFKSVLITGRAEEVTDPQEKAEAFTAFMNKLQPEGGHAPIDPADERYAKRLAGTAMVKIHVEDISAKFKFGQNWKAEKRAAVGEKLLARGDGPDRDTVEMMKRYCPAHRD